MAMWRVKSRTRQNEILTPAVTGREFGAKVQGFGPAGLFQRRIEDIPWEQRRPTTSSTTVTC